MRTLFFLLLLGFLSLSRLPCAGRIRFRGVLEFFVVDAILWRGWFVWHDTSVVRARGRRTRCGTNEPYSHFKFEFFFYTNERFLLDENIQYRLIIRRA